MRMTCLVDAIGKDSAIHDRLHNQVSVDAIVQVSRYAAVKLRLNSLLNNKTNHSIFHTDKPSCRLVSSL